MSRLRGELIAYVDALVTIWPGSTGNRLRLWWIKRRVAQWAGGGAIGQRVVFEATDRMSFGRDVSIGSGSFLSAIGAGGIVIGDRVSLNTNVHVNASVGGYIRIGDCCLIGPNVVMRTADHRFDRTDLPIRDQGHRVGDIVIAEDVWIGANVTLVGGVSIGRGAVIAAGAVVTRPIPPGAVAAGVPARVIKRRAELSH